MKNTLMTEAGYRRLETILDSMFEGVAALDSGLNIILVNPRFCSLFGMEPAELKSAELEPGELNRQEGLSLLEFTRSAELEEAARQVLAMGRPFEFTLKRYMSGTEQHFRVFVTPLADESGEAGTPPPEAGTAPPSGVVIVAGDISRIARLEQVRRDFAANVSHELRTPIQVIKGFAENILDSGLDNKDETRRFVEIIRKSAGTMENLVNDLLTLVALEDENSPRPPMEETFLAPVISEAVGMVEIAARKKEIAIETFCPPDLKARLYASFFSQALVNLLENGIKYSAIGSKIRVYAYTDNEWLVIEVKDKGIGIPAEHLGRVFERFYRVDRSRSRDAGGTGLGLAIVRHIAILHNGTAEAESHAGEGSVFRLRIKAFACL